MADDAQAQRGGGGRGGGGGFSRGGIAAGGGFSGGRASMSMPSRVDRGPAAGDRQGLSRDSVQTLPANPVGGDRVQNLPANSNRGDHVQNLPTNPPGNGSDCQNCWDSGDAAKVIAIGAAARAAAAANTGAVLSTLPCSVTPITVNEVPYYRCPGAWYSPGYGPEGLVYTAVPPPAGY
jgi:hypothetical protein